LLGLLGIPFVLVPASVDERKLDTEGPAQYLERVVKAKLAAACEAAAQIACAGVLVADTIVLLGQEVLGKPSSLDQAREMLTDLSGRDHEVRTRFAIAGSGLSREHAQTVSTRVRFRVLTGEEIARYAATGEGLDKAGGYAIQGVGSFAVEQITGSYANVVGLPVCEVVLALRKLGLLGAFP